MNLFPIIISLIKIVSIIIPLLIAVAYFTIAERKLMAIIQRRKGPNVVGFMGLLQPLADGLKLLVKETVIPTNANTFAFVISPILTLFLSLFGWAVIPFSFTSYYATVDLGLLFLLAVSSLGVYGVILSG